ncbi:putative peptidase S54, rhomboid domain, Rhomboid-like superfamily [Helianthus annuus]|uniref:Peptidase S54, rhomboid domain, Rhomboid-like superfamily n=1 Tax=Helianthus annuus TaxID=4232 RepID=A0A9K3J2D9_HELAN|nr:putative peptidase S54, rhomboid domain, Rhomboid-like superfamily [Helianthus annuus]
MIQNFTIQWDNIKGGRYHTMITSAFSHKNLKHIVSNMITLYSFGKSGASGAVNAILMLYILLYPMKTLLVDFMIPVPALLAVNEIFTVFENM